MPNATVRANARTLPLNKEGLRDALDGATFAQMLTLQEALIHAQTALMGFQNQPRAEGLVEELIEDEITRFCELSDEVWHSAKMRFATDLREIENRTRIMLIRQLHAGPEWSEIVGDATETMCAVTQSRLSANRNAGRRADDEQERRTEGGR